MSRGNGKAQAHGQPDRAAELPHPPESTPSPAELSALVQRERQARLKACQEEVNAVLAKHRCTLQMVPPQISIVVQE